MDIFLSGKILSLLNLTMQSRFLNVTMHCLNKYKHRPMRHTQSPLNTNYTMDIYV